MSNVGVIREILRWGGANLEHRNQEGNTALLIASGRLQLGMAQALLQAGCLETTKNNYGNAPTDVVGIAPHDDGSRRISKPADVVCMRWLLERGPAFRAISWLWPVGASSREEIAKLSSRRSKAEPVGGCERRLLPLAVNVLHHGKQSRMPLKVLKATCR